MNRHNDSKAKLGNDENNLSYRLQTICPICKVAGGHPEYRK